MADFLSWAGVIIGGLSLIVSGVAMWGSWKAQREAAAAQKKIAEIEEKREKEKILSSRQAFLHPELRKTDKGSYRLYLVNSGKAEARNVQVKLDGVPLKDHHAAVKGDEMPTLIGPNGEVSCLLALSLGCTPPFEIEVFWDDDSGKGHVYHGTLTL
ncbi:MAG: hypothetical protein NUV70_07120 [Caldiserica bacterium]|jgi:hypothetical protein|nr:hypothetical protein [Caldisericota bacterium]